MNGLDTGYRLELDDDLAFHQQTESKGAQRKIDRIFLSCLSCHPVKKGFAPFSYVIVFVKTWTSNLPRLSR